MLPGELRPKLRRSYALLRFSPRLPVIVLALSCAGGAMMTYVLAASRLLTDRGIGWLPRFQHAWDSLAGTAGLRFAVLTLMLGAAGVCHLWVTAFTIAMLRNGWFSSAQVWQRVGSSLAPLLAMLPAGAAAMLFGETVTPVALIVSGLAIAWSLGRAALEAEPGSPVLEEPVSAAKRSARLALLTAVVAPWVLLPAAALKQRHTNCPDAAAVSTPSIVLSFDAEEDWAGRMDMVRLHRRPCRNTYFSTFKYVESGELMRLAEGLADMRVYATFYCTPNLAANCPDTLRRLEQLGHEIGLHLHMHNVLSVEYPYETDHLDEIATCDFSVQRQAVRAAHATLSKALGHRVTTFRSGGWSNSPGVVAACAAEGFTSISNHSATFRLPCGMWQIATAHDGDYVTHPELILEAVSRDTASGIVPLFSHPMVIYDHVRDQPRTARTDEFLATITQARRVRPDMRFCTTSQVVADLRYVPPPAPRSATAALACAMPIVVAGVITFRTSRRRAAGNIERLEQTAKSSERAPAKRSLAA